MSQQKYNFIDKFNSGIILRLYIQPGASQCEVCGFFCEPARLKIRIKAPPVDGKANKVLIEFLGQWLNISRKNITIIRGETSRQKDIYLLGDYHKILHQILDLTESAGH